MLTLNLNKQEQPKYESESRSETNESRTETSEGSKEVSQSTSEVCETSSEEKRNESREEGSKEEVNSRAVPCMEVPYEAALSSKEILKLITNPEDRPHADFGGSSASIWSKCYAHIPLKKQRLKVLKEQNLIPEQPIWTIQGTQAHACSEQYAKASLWFKVSGDETYLNNVKEAFQMYEDAAENETEAAQVDEQVKAALEYTRLITDEALEGFVTGKQFGFERQLTLCPNLNMFGYTDFWAIHINDKGKRVAVIADFKFGRVDVDIKKNVQLLFYAAALAREEEEEGRMIDEAVCYIYQPKTRLKWKKTKFTKKQLVAGYEMFIKAAKEQVINQNNKAKYGDHCEYCDEKASCDAYQKHLSKTSGIAFLEPADLSFPSVSEMPLDRLITMYSYKDQFESLFSDISKALYYRAMQGQKVAGYKLVKATKRAAWKDKNEVKDQIEQLTEKYELEVAYTKSAVKTPKQVKEAAYALVKQDKAGLDEVEAFIEDVDTLWHIPEGGLVLVPEDDSREEVEIKSLLTPVEVKPQREIQLDLI